METMFHSVFIVCLEYVYNVFTFILMRHRPIFSNYSVTTNSLSVSQGVVKLDIVHRRIDTDQRYKGNVEKQSYRGRVSQS